jgi:transposase
VVGFDARRVRDEITEQHLAALRHKAPVTLPEHLQRNRGEYDQCGRASALFLGLLRRKQPKKDGLSQRSIAFRNSKAVGAVLGLTPSKYQSGEINRTGAISRRLFHLGFRGRDGTI